MVIMVMIILRMVAVRAVRTTLRITIILMVVRMRMMMGIVIMLVDMMT